MGTNLALVQRLEWYMDELLDGFEDLVTKSLVAVTIAIGGVIAVLIYALKIINNRSVSNLSRRSSRTIKSCSNSSKCSKKSKNNVVLACSSSAPKCSKSVNTEVISPIPSANEKVLSSVILSNNKSCASSLTSLPRKGSSSRLMISTLPFCCPNCNTSTACTKSIASRKSCCSLCCSKDRR